MEDIKAGEYVRTKKKGIFKVCSIKKTSYGYYCGTTDNEHIATFTIGKGGNAEIKNDIVKHSSNIIDLIEVGDYVNGYKVSYKESTLLFTDVKGIDRSGYHIPISQYGEGIKSIVTREQFQSVEFKVEE